MQLHHLPFAFIVQFYILHLCTQCLQLYHLSAITLAEHIRHIQFGSLTCSHKLNSTQTQRQSRSTIKTSSLIRGSSCDSRSFSQTETQSQCRDSFATLRAALQARRVLREHSRCNRAYCALSLYRTSLRECALLSARSPRLM